MSTFMDYVIKFLEFYCRNRGIVQVNEETFAFGRQNMDYRMFYVIFNIASVNFRHPWGAYPDTTFKQIKKPSPI